MKRIIYGVICCLCIGILAGVLLVEPKMVSAAAKEIKMKVSTNEIGIGKTATIKMTNLPSRATCTYSSSNKKIATVSSTGKVKGIAAGKVVITCKVRNTSKTKTTTNSYSVEMEVKNPYLSETSGEVIIGETINLDIMCKPKGATYKWNSSDNSVAKVSNKGLITPLTEGNAMISCNVSWGKQKKTLTYRLRVVKTEFSLPELSIVLGEETKLELFHQPKEATYRYLSSNEEVVSVTEKGIIQGMSFGKATITCQIKLGKRKEVCQCEIKVTKAELSEQSVTIEEGMTTQLTTFPHNSEVRYEWNSENPEVAVVDQNGLVAGNKSGTTKITCLVTFQQITYTLHATVVVTEKKETEEEQKPTTGDGQPSGGGTTSGEIKPGENTGDTSEDTQERVPGTNEYIYDALHRLVKVIYSDGTCLEYTYDANGNITEITRS